MTGLGGGMKGSLGRLAKAAREVRETASEDADFRRGLTLLFFFSLFASFISFSVPIYLSSIGLNGYEIGLLVSLYAIASIFVAFPTGIINDKWTIRLTLVVGMALLAAFFLGLGFFESFVIFMPLFLIGGLGNNLGDVSLRTLLFKTKIEGMEGRKFGSFSLTRIIAMSCGLFIGGGLVFLVGFPLGLKIMGLIYLVLIPFVSFKSTARYKVKLKEYGRDMLNAKVISIGIVMFLFSLHWGAERTSYGLFLRTNLGLDMFMVGLYTSLTIPFLGLTSYYFGRRIDAGKSNMRRIFFVGMIVSGVFHILNTVPVPWFSFLMRIFHEAGDGMADIAVYFWISRLFNTERIGGGSGVMFAVMLMGQVTGSLIFGPIGQIYGYHIPLIISGITSILCSFLLALFLKIFHVSDAGKK